MQGIFLHEEQLWQFIGQYIWPLLRVSGFYFAMPVVGARTVPARVRIFLALCTAILLAPVLPPPPTVSFVSLAGMMLVVKEVLIGIALGFMLQVVMHVFVLAGQMIAMKMGLGFASMNDPSSGVAVTILSQFYLLLTTLLFLAINGHIVVIQMLVDSYQSFPIDQAGISAEQAYGIVLMGSWLFSSALVVCLPLFTASLLVNMSFGVMSRSAPQMNIFAVGFPLTLVISLLFMWYTLANFLPMFDRIMVEGFNIVLQLLGAP